MNKPERLRLNFLANMRTINDLAKSIKMRTEWILQGDDIEQNYEIVKKAIEEMRRVINK